MVWLSMVNPTWFAGFHKRKSLKGHADLLYWLSMIPGKKAHGVAYIRYMIQDRPIMHMVLYMIMHNVAPFPFTICTYMDRLIGPKLARHYPHVVRRLP